VAEEVLITGHGVLSAFGWGADALRDAVFRGTPGFRPVTRFDAGRYRARVAAASDVSVSQADALRGCAERALEMAGLATPLAAATLVGTQGDHAPVTAFWRAAAGAEADPARERLQESAPGHQSEALARACGLDGPALTFTNACVAASSALALAGQLIASGRIDVAVCGGCYLVEEEFFSKFDAGRAFAADGRLRAFSADRTGLLLGDGTAVLVLEAAGHARRRRARPLARLAGWGMASDAHHVCQPHPDGVGLAAAVSRALATAGVEPRAVGYVNAHGTGTPLNDVAETRGLRRALGEAASRIPVSSTKTTTGHTLEASGALEAVITILALAEQVAPPTASFTTPDPACDLDCVPNEPRAVAMEHALSVSSAFGGANAALLLARA
jgi:3-oxoacyl-[acyl-carrier-protein] synthase II